MTRQSMLVTIGFGLLVCISWGCATGPVGPDMLRLVASPAPYVADIPLPLGFALVDQSSEDWSSGPIRYVRHRYAGRADKYAVRVFYVEQMPLARWTAISNAQVHGRVTMLYQRGDESCSVTIEDDRAGRVAIEVRVAPLGRGRATALHE